MNDWIGMIIVAVITGVFTLGGVFVTNFFNRWSSKQNIQDTINMLLPAQSEKAKIEIIYTEYAKKRVEACQMIFTEMKNAEKNISSLKKFIDKINNNHLINIDKWDFELRQSCLTDKERELFKKEYTTNKVDAEKKVLTEIGDCTYNEVLKFSNMYQNKLIFLSKEISDYLFKIVQYYFIFTVKYTRHMNMPSNLNLPKYHEVQIYYNIDNLTNNDMDEVYKEMQRYTNFFIHAIRNELDKNIADPFKE